MELGAVGDCTTGVVPNTRGLHVEYFRDEEPPAAFSPWCFVLGSHCSYVLFRSLTARSHLQSLSLVRTHIMIPRYNGFVVIYIHGRL